MIFAWSARRLRRAIFTFMYLAACLLILFEGLMYPPIREYEDIFRCIPWWLTILPALLFSISFLYFIIILIKEFYFAMRSRNYKHHLLAAFYCVLLLVMPICILSLTCQSDVRRSDIVNKKIIEFKMGSANPESYWNARNSEKDLGHYICIPIGNSLYDRVDFYDGLRYVRAMVCVKDNKVIDFYIWSEYLNMYCANEKLASLGENKSALPKQWPHDGLVKKVASVLSKEEVARIRILNNSILKNLWIEKGEDAGLNYDLFSVFIREFDLILSEYVKNHPLEAMSLLENVN